MSSKKLPQGIRQLPSGNYQARVPFEGKQVSVGSSKSLATAKRLLRAAQAEIDAGNFLPPEILREQAKKIREKEDRQAQRNRVTVNEVGRAWIEWKRQAGTKDSTIYTYERHLARYVAPVMGDRPITSVTVEDIDQWYEEVAKGISATTLNNVYRTTKALFAYASGDTKGLPRSFDPYIKETPCDVTVAKRRSRTKGDVVATDEEIRRLAEFMPSETALMVWIAGYNGLRIGEVLALRKKSFTRDSAGQWFLSVTEQVQSRGGGTKFTSPKSAAGIRTIPVHGVIVPMVEQRISELVEDGDLLFPRSLDGNRPLHANTIQRQFSKARARMVQEGHSHLEELRFHSLRHTALTRLGRMGATHADLMRFGGHSDVEAVMIYQQTDKARLASLINSPQ